jgi:transcriptional antiterminator/mannitol/fructose-specific phosphotransferase system IIA component (Ntr-type)
MVRYTLRDVERWLQERNARLIRKPGRGILIEVPGRLKRDLIGELESLTGYTLFLSPTERLHLLVLSLLMSDRPLLAKQLELRLGVSRTTVLKDMDKAEEWLEAHNLRLIRRPNYGFKVVGEERDWRETVVAFCLGAVGEIPLLALCEGSEAAFRSEMRGKVGLLRVLCAFFEDLELRYLKKLVDSIESTLQLQFADTARASLILHLALMAKRAQEGRTVQVPPDHSEGLRGRREFCAAKTVARQVEQRYGFALLESEVAYVAMQVLGAKTRRTIADIVGERKAAGTDLEALEIVDGILAEASTYLHPYLRVDQQLIRSLAFHIEPVLNRLRFGLPIGNSLLEDIRRKYPYVFKIARRSSVIVEERVGRRIPEEEIGYIAMHLGAAMERLRTFSRVKRRVMVICGEGVATAWLLVSRMEADLPEIEVVEVMSASQMFSQRILRGDIDAVISTVPLGIAGIPIIVVSPLLDAKDRARIREGLNIGVMGASISEAAGSGGEAERQSLDNLITADTIRLRVIARTWHEVVDQVGYLLLEFGAIEPRYIEAMKELIMRHGPYVVLVPGVALLHARPEDGVRRLCVGLVTLQTPVSFGHPHNDPVDLAIALGAVDAGSHLKALAQLAEILDDQARLNAIKEASRTQEILELVSSVSAT